jgi:hypothetical protein
MNVFDYLSWRGDVPLSISPFNPVDSLVLAELSYTDFSGVLSPDGEPVSLASACAAFFATRDRAEVAARKSYTARAPLLMDFMLAGARFRDVRLCRYRTVNDYAEATQFAALTLLLPDETAFVAFRGTDGTVLGWKEDMEMSYHSHSKGQVCAAEYLTGVGQALSCPLRVGGHSKGGNLAVYSAAFCDPAVQARITDVYTLDGPGFHDDVRAEAGYRAVMDRTHAVIPDTSIIGLLLAIDCPHRVVRSDASGIVQHDGFTWQVGPTDFEPAPLSRMGEFMENTISTWVSRQDGETLRSMVDSIFSVLETPGEDSFLAMRRQKRKTAELIMAGIRALPREKQLELLQAAGKLVASGGTGLRETFLPGAEAEHKPEE